MWIEKSIRLIHEYYFRKNNMSSNSLEEGFKLIRLDLNHKDSRWIADKMNNSIAAHDGMSFDKYSIVKVKMNVLNIDRKIITHVCFNYLSNRQTCREVKIDEG